MFYIAISSFVIASVFIVISEFIGISTQNKLLTESLSRANEELKEMDRLKSHFLANTSHELRTPLNGILGLVEAILDGTDGEINSQVKDHLAMVLKSAKNLKNLVNDVLDFTKLQTGKVTLSKETFSLREFLDNEIQPAIAGLILGKPIAYQIELADPLPSVYADRTKLRQIFLNLLGNAAKFTDQGTITVRAKEIEKGGVQIAVEDTGIGIKAEDLPVLFDDFRQADGSSTRKYEGTGLGLAITRRLVEAHNGTIHAASSLGKGSVFTFDLPSQSSVMPTAVTGKGERLLLVDDTPINLESLSMNMEKRGYKAEKATSAQEALEKLKAGGEYSMIISDIMMPGMDGFELLREVRKNYDINIPFILLTAKTAKEDEEKGWETGANDYLVKPFDLHELLSKVRAILTHPTASLEGRKELVLAVDDNPVNLAAVKARIEEQGWDIETALSGEEALQKYSELHPDLILLDIMMPGLSGYDVCRKIREEYNDPITPIVFLTALQEETDKIYGINAGGTDFITKPFDKEDLIHRIALYMQKRHSKKQK